MKIRHLFQTVRRFFSRSKRAAVPAIPAMVPAKTSQLPYDPLVTFRLLNVPQVVLTDIINFFDECEMIKLSLCSQRAQNLVKQLRCKSKKYYITINAAWEKRTYIYWAEVFGGDLITAEHVSKAPAPLENLEIVKINGISAPYMVYKNNYEFEYLYTYWEDMVLGTKTIIALTFDLFSKIDIGGLYFGQNTLWIVDWIRSQQMSIDEAEMNADKVELTKKQYENVLQNCIATRLTFFAKPPPNFKFKGKLNKCTAYNIRPCNWITLKNLMETDAKYIQFDDQLELTNAQINTFLKQWLAGGSPKLKYFSLSLKSFVFEEIVAGFEDKVQKIENKEYFSLGGGVRCYFGVAYSIQRGGEGDGASIFWSDPQGERHTVSLNMIVWPEFSENEIEDEED